MRTLKYSNHAIVRQQQRGISQSTTELIIKHADQHTYCGNGCQSIWISRRLAVGLIAEGKLSTQEGDRIPHIRIVIAEDGTVVTAYPEHRRRHRSGRSRRSGSSHRPRRRR